MKLFDMEGPLFTFLTLLADLLLLNILFLIGCLPVITIGASVTALYSCTLKICKGQEGPVIASYIKGFKANVLQSFCIWIPSVISFFILRANILIYQNNPSGKYLPLLIGAYILLIALFFMVMLVFPVLAKFENTTRNTVKNALLIGLGNLGWIFCILLINALPLIITLFVPLRYGFVYIFWLLFGFSSSALAVSYLLEKKVFPKYQ